MCYFATFSPERLGAVSCPDSVTTPPPTNSLQWIWDKSVNQSFRSVDPTGKKWPLSNFLGSCCEGRCVMNERRVGPFNSCSE